MQRLQNLDMSECPAVYPDDMTEAPWALHTYMNSTHMALRGMSDDALLDLEQRYDMNYAHLHKIHPTWMTLAPPPDLKCWAAILNEQKIDIEAVMDLRNVIAGGHGIHGVDHGYYEAIRIIAHFIKDTEHAEWRKGPSAWLHNACSESLNAMMNWHEWDCHHNGKRAAWSSRASTSLPTFPRSHWDDYKPVTGPVRGLR